MFKTKGLSNLDILVLKSVEKYGEILITECESKRSFLEETLGCGNIKFTMTTEVKSCTVASVKVYANENSDYLGDMSVLGVSELKKFWENRRLERENQLKHTRENSINKLLEEFE